jgi:ferrous iron transport protein B
MTSAVLPVTNLKEEEEGIIHSLTGGRALTSRFAGMGISIGKRVKVLRSRRGPLILLVSDTRVALGRGEAGNILVFRTRPYLPGTEPDKASERILAALVGQPNVGKSTVFNILTGLSQHVGNWPGKTVEKKEGVHVSGDREIRIVDLPGTYGLTAFSEEEKVARDFIIGEYPDVIVLIVNAAALERNLYLLSELLLLGPPIIVAVNMIDLAESQGVHVDIKALQKSLGVPVIPMIAKRNTGIRELVSEIVRLAEGKLDYHPRIPEVRSDHKDVFLQISEEIRTALPESYMVPWIATKIMEGDAEVSKKMEEVLAPEAWSRIQSVLIKHEDSLQAVVGGRYGWIENVTRASIHRFKRGQVLKTDRIDRFLTRPLFGIPVLIGILAVVFLLTYQVGFPIQAWLESVLSAFSRHAEAALSAAPPWLSGLLLDGIIAGAGSVLTFLPVLLIFFTALAILEDIGYMSRAAFVMDRFMHLVGLHGKSFIPMCLGFGCNVPAVLGARIVESPKARLLTIILAPFVPCTARLAVLAVVTAAVFGQQGGFVSWSLVALNILILGLGGTLISRWALKDESMPFIMELPLYQQPDPRTIGIAVWTRTAAFIRRAGTVILAVSIALWFLSSFPGTGIEESALGRIGRILEPIGKPLGLDWKMLVALTASLIAKENAVATLGVLYGVGREGLRTVLANAISPASALSFLVVLMLFVPCAATLAVMRQEIGNRKWFLGTLAGMLLVSYTAGFLAYRLALVIF